MTYIIRIVLTFIAAFFMAFSMPGQTSFWLTVATLFLLMTAVQLLMDGVAWLCDNHYLP